MSNRQAIAVLAGVVVVVGLVIGFWSLTIDRDYRTADGRTDVTCGSAFGGLDSDADTAEFGGSIRDAYAGGDGSDNGGYVASCQDKLSSQRLLAGVVIGVGALTLAFLALTASRSAAPAAADDDVPDDADAAT